LGPKAVPVVLARPMGQGSLQLTRPGCLNVSAWQRARALHSSVDPSERMKA
jgi:hypothetical protein